MAMPSAGSITARMAITASGSASMEARDGPDQPTNSSMLVRSCVKSVRRSPAERPAWNGSGSLTSRSSVLRRRSCVKR